MGNSSPTLLVEANSAWVLIVAVSVVTLPVALLLRRAIRRPGGIASSALLALPLLLPLVAAFIYRGGVLPEITSLRPAAVDRLVGESERLLNLLLFADDRRDAVAFYSFSGAPGRWLLMVALGISSFMVLRRVAGIIVVRTLLHRCEPLRGERAALVERMVATLSRSAGLRFAPEVLVLPPGACGAFTVGRRRAGILVSQDLLERLTNDELEAMLAHEIAHISSKDTRVLSGAGILRDLTAWNPMSHVALRLLAADRELEADRRAAEMTGRPLALASGLIKLCELMRGRRGRVYAAAVGALRPRGRIHRRVMHLLALADHNTLALSSARLPFVAAALLVTLLGLQVAAKVSSFSGSKLAIVWGSPEVEQSHVWSLKKKRAHGDSVQIKEPRPQARFAALPDEGFAVRTKDLSRWLSAMAKEAKRRSGMPPRAWLDAQRGWEAVPVFSGGDVGPLGIYRVELAEFPLGGRFPR